MTARTFFSFLLPGGLIFALAAGFAQSNLLASSLPLLTKVFPSLVLAAGMLLGWRFNRSRLVFAVLVLALSDRFLFHFAQGNAATTPSGAFIFHTVAILLPLNLATLSLLKERGIITFRGIWRLFLILLQFLVLAAFRLSQQFAINRYLEVPIVQSPLLEHFPTLPLPQTAAVTITVAFILVGAALITRRGSIENGFFWALLAAAFGLAARKFGALSTFYFSTAGLILLISVIESSHAMAFRDELTGLPGRRALNELFLKLGSRYTVAMVDIDFFKKFNDTYGHDVGDQVLRMVASKLAVVGGGGKAFRYGGEEFTVVFPGSALGEAFPHLEELRATIKNAGFVIRGSNRPRKKPARPASAGKGGRKPPKSVSVTVSIGAAECTAQNADSQNVVKAADKALYRAKKGGRNRVCS